MKAMRRQNLIAAFSLALPALVALYSGAACADVYGFVEDGRVSVIISDTPPADPRYLLFKKGSVDPSNAIPDESSGAEPPEPAKYRGHILAAARATKVDPALIRAVISVESGYNPSARSSAGAVGLMQLMPETARRYGVKDRLDPAQNINGGARYLRDLKVMFGGDLKLVLAAYNAGEEAVMRYGRRVPPFRETEAYVPKVLSHYRKFRTGTPSARDG
jgi:soluble lytic murein transglycosylase-like protein